MTDKDKELYENIKFLSKCCHNEYNDIRIDAVLLGSLDLITRQQAEIERLKAKCENTQIGYNFAQDEIKTLKKDKYKLQKALNQSEDYRVIAKSEAVKEFVEMVKEKIYTAHFGRGKNEFFVTTINPDDLDNLVKEIAGENND